MTLTAPPRNSRCRTTASTASSTTPARGLLQDEHAVAQLLIGVAVTLLPLLAAVIAFELVWPLLGANTWSAAAAVVTGWAVASAGWLCLRRWPVGAVLMVIGAPAVVLAVAAAIGWLSPAGLVLWGPLSTVLAVPLVMPSQPVSSDSRPPREHSWSR